MGNQNNGDWSDFSFLYPFNHPEHYHSYCLITDFNNQEQVIHWSCMLASEGGGTRHS